MFGIPTMTTDYTNDPEIFDPKKFQVNPDLSREKNLYYLHKAIVTAYRKAKIPRKVANEVAERNANNILDTLLSENF